MRGARVSGILIAVFACAAVFILVGNSYLKDTKTPTPTPSVIPQSSSMVQADSPSQHVLPPIVTGSNICTFSTVPHFTTYNPGCASVTFDCYSGLTPSMANLSQCGAQKCFDAFNTNNIFFFNQGYPFQITDANISRGFLTRNPGANVTLFEMIIKFVQDNNHSLSTHASAITGETIFTSGEYQQADSYSTPLGRLAAEMPAARVNHVIALLMGGAKPTWLDLVYVPERCSDSIGSYEWLETNNVTVGSVYSFVATMLTTINPTGGYINPTSKWYQECMAHTAGVNNEKAYICSLFGPGKYYSYDSLVNATANPNPYDDFAVLLKIANEAASECNEPVSECFGSV